MIAPKDERLTVLGADANVGELDGISDDGNDHADDDEDASLEGLVREPPDEESRDEAERIGRDTEQVGVGVRVPELFDDGRREESQRIERLRNANIPVNGGRITISHQVDATKEGNQK